MKRRGWVRVSGVVLFWDRGGHSMKCFVIKPTVDLQNTEARGSPGELEQSAPDNHIILFINITSVGLPHTDNLMISVRMIFNLQTSQRVRITHFDLLGRFYDPML